MGKTATSILSLVVGIVLGGIGATIVVGSLMTGVGMVTGFSTGMCLTIEAAENLGLMNDEQVDLVVDKALENASNTTKLPQDEKIVGTAEGCRKLIGELKQN